jgi:hypothetical protein
MNQHREDDRTIETATDGLADTRTRLSTTKECHQVQRDPTIGMTQRGADDSWIKPVTSFPERPSLCKDLPSTTKNCNQVQRKCRVSTTKATMPDARLHPPFFLLSGSSREKGRSVTLPQTHARTGEDSGADDDAWYSYARRV